MTPKETVRPSHTVPPTGYTNEWEHLHPIWGLSHPALAREPGAVCSYGEIDWLAAKRGGGSAGTVADSCCGLRIYLSLRYAVMAGATTLSDLASALDVRTAEASIVAELKAGSEDAFYWLIARYN